MDLRNKVLNMEQRLNQPEPTPVPTAISTQATVPPVSAPLPQMTQMMQQPFFYPYPQPGGYPFAFPGYKQPCTYKQFLDCKPSEYRGSPDPNITLNWLREMMKALDACNCENELKVKYASRMLKGDAMVWWDSITAISQNNSRRVSPGVNSRRKYVNSIVAPSRLLKSRRNL